MAFTVTARGSYGPTTEPATSRSTGTFTPANSSLLVAGFIGQHDGSATNAELSVSGGSLSWTDVAELDGANAIPWDGSADYKNDFGVYRASVTTGASMSVTFTTTVGSSISGVAFDVTGHNTTSPVVQYKQVGQEGTSQSISATLDSSPTVGNLLVVIISAAADSGGGFTTPTAGTSRTFTQLYNQSGAWVQSYAGYRTVVSGDSATITCSDVGNSIGASAITVIEIAAAGGGATNLVVADTAHAHTVDAPTLTQVHALVVADAAHAHSVDAPTLTQVHALVVADASHAHTVDNVTLEVAGDLVVADTVHTLRSGNQYLPGVWLNVDLTQVHQLAVADTAHAHTVDNVTLEVAGDLVVADTAHAHTVDAPTLTQVHALVVADASHAHTVDNVTVAVGLTLTVADTSHGHTVDAVVVNAGGFLAAVSGRHLVDANGDTWHAQGDAAWSLFAQLSLTDAQTYLDSIAAKGFNLVLANLIEHLYLDNDAGENYAGVSAFTGTAFQSSLNTTYWDLVDDVIEYAATKGVTVMACPAYYGYGTDGWAGELNAATNTQVRDYGEQIGLRLRSHPNLVWMLGHDDVPSTTDKARQAALWEGISIDAGDTHLLCLGGARGDGGSTSNGSMLDLWAGWTYLSDVAFDTVYGGDGQYTVEECHYAWANSLPVMYLEGIYEDNADSWSAQTGRRQLVGGLAGGCLGGYISGHEGVWGFGTGYSGWEGDGNWANDLGDIAYTDTRDLTTWVLTVTGLYGLVPDTTNTFLTGGVNTEWNRANAAFNASAGVGLVYMPNSRTVTLDLTELTGSQFTITRVDPADPSSTSELTTTASGSGYNVTGQGTNSGGQSDWILLITQSGVVSLTVADSSHGHTVDAPTLTQVHQLVVAETAHAHSADAVSLTQVHQLAVADTAHAHSGDAVTLVQGSTLAVAGTQHAHGVDTPTLTQTHLLVVQDALHVHTAGAVSFILLFGWDGSTEHEAVSVTVWTGTAEAPMVALEVVE